jgi:(S)-mandelate dehydrogenase
MERRYYRGRGFRRAVSIDELRSLAERRVPRMAFEYLDGGAEDEATLRRNREVFERIAFVPRTLVDVSERTQTVEVLGQAMQSPLVIAPTGFNGMLRRDGDLALAAAAKKAGIPFSLSTASTNTIESVAERVGGRLWFQLYPVHDRTVVRKLVERAGAAGYEALILTTDVPIYGNREWEQRNYLALGRPSLRTKLDVLAHPRWLFDVMVPHGAPALANVAEFLPPGKKRAIDGARYMSTQLNERLDWDAVRWLREIWPRRFIVKGLLALRDAEIAAGQGVDGIVLSNHGGRQLDGAISPMEILPQVCRESGHRDDRQRFSARLARGQGAGTRSEGRPDRTRRALWPGGWWTSGRGAGAGHSAQRDRPRPRAARLPVLRRTVARLPAPNQLSGGR